MKKQVFSVLLTLCMASSTMPAAVFGAEEESVAVTAEVPQNDDSAKEDKEAGSSEAKAETPAEDIAKENTAKEDSASGTEEDAPKEEEVKEETSKEETAKDEVAEEETSKEETTKDGAAEEETSKEETTKDEAAEEETSKEETTKDGVAEEETSKEEKPEDEIQKEASESKNTQENETAQDAGEQKTAEVAAQSTDEKNAKEIVVQANEGEKDVTSWKELQAALADDSIHTINITGAVKWTDPLSTGKKIVVKSGSTFTWSVYQDTFNAPLEIESGATFTVNAFDFMSKAIMSGSVTNNGTINVTGRGECFWNATVTGAGSFGATTEDTYIRYGTVPTDKLKGSYRINILDDQSKVPTVELPKTMYVGDTITPTFTNIIEGVDLASVFNFKWKDGNSFERYNGAVSPTLTKAGTLNLNVSVKKPYAMHTSGNSSPGSLDVKGTVAKRLLGTVYVDAGNGSDDNLGDTTTSALKTVGKAIDNVAEGGTIILLSNCSSSAVLEKSVTIRSADGNKFTFNPSYIYVYNTVNFESVNFEGLTVSKAPDNIGNIAFNNCTGTVSSIADSIANVTVEKSVLGTTEEGVLSASNTLTLSNSSFSGKFQTNNFVSNGNNTLNVVKNRSSRIEGSITITDPITIQVNVNDFEKGLKVLEIPEGTGDTVQDKVQLTEAQKQNGLYKLKGQEQYNGTYIIVSQRTDAEGKIAVANEPVINQEVGKVSEKLWPQNVLHDESAEWSGFSNTAEKKWAADDIPELTLVLKTNADMHFDSTFDPQKMSVHTWTDIADWDYIPNDENKNSNVEILVKDGQGVSADGTTFTFTVRYPKIERLEQTITVDTTVREAHCNDVLEAREAAAETELSYESSDPTVATVDPKTGAITAMKPGTTQIIIKAAQSDLYKEAVSGYELTVDHASVTAPTVITGLVYNGKAQKLVNPGSTAEGKVMYKVGDGEWSEEIPEATEAGEYTISYKVVRGEGHGETDVQQLKVTIIPAKEDDSKSDDPKNDDPKNNDPKNDDPKSDDPKNDDPKNDDPKNEDGNKSDGKDDTSDTNKTDDTDKNNNTDKTDNTNNTSKNNNTNTTSTTNTNKTSDTQSTAAKSSTTVSAVKTGDATNILGYISVAVIALAAAAGIFFIRKKDK